MNFQGPHKLKNQGVGTGHLRGQYILRPGSNPGSAIDCVTLESSLACLSLSVYDVGTIRAFGVVIKRANPVKQLPQSLAQSECPVKISAYCIPSYIKASITDDRWLLTTEICSQASATHGKEQEIGIHSSLEKCKLYLQASPDIIVCRWSACTCGLCVCWASPDKD